MGYSVCESQARVYEQIVGGLSSGVVAVDASGMIAVVNTAANQHLNLGPEVLAPGIRFDQVPGVSALRDLMEEVRATGKPIHRHEVVVEVSEGPRVLGTNVTPIDEGAGKQGVVFLFTDLTEVKRLARAAELNRQLAQIGELTAGVVHELRNPLSVVSGMAELLIRRLEKDPPLRDKAQAVLNEAEQMGRLVTQFLGFARPFQLKFQPCAALPIMERTRELCGALAKERGVRVDLSGPHEDQRFEADPAALVQALGNVLRNAIEVSTAGGHVELSSNCGKDWIAFEVADHGPGICLAPGEDLFSPFFSKREGGTGLGLAIAQRAIAGHCGTIVYANRERGGAVFTLRIPRHRPDEVAQTAG